MRNQTDPEIRQSLKEAIMVAIQIEKRCAKLLGQKEELEYGKENLLSDD